MPRAFPTASKYDSAAVSLAGPIRNISETALWVAVYRAQESERADAVFRDPFARKLAGDRGTQIAAVMPFAQQHSWSYTARTWLIDQVIERKVQQGADMIINLAAGLDSRPYRMQLPTSLRWIEIDLPDMLNYKQDVLASERPLCTLERVPLDLKDTAGRRVLFQRLGDEAKHGVVVSEGLIIYFEAGPAAELARDLAIPSSFKHWVTDLTSPALLKMLQKTIGRPLVDAGSPLKFAPREGPEFFIPYGWRSVETRSLLHTAAKLKSLSLGMRLLALLPDSAGRMPDKPWGGVCVLENREPALTNQPSEDGSGHAAA
jgi:methyltransferase (TIGR00027 family)